MMRRIPPRRNVSRSHRIGCLATILAFIAAAPILHSYEIRRMRNTYNTMRAEIRAHIQDLERVNRICDPERTPNPTWGEQLYAKRQLRTAQRAYDEEQLTENTGKGYFRGGRWR